MRFVPVLVVMLALCAGCGSSGSSISKAELVRRANAICAAVGNRFGDARLHDDAQAGGFGSNPTSLRHYAEDTGRLLPILNYQARKLAALPRPDRDAGTFHQIVVDAKAELVDASRARAAASHGSSAQALQWENRRQLASGRLGAAWATVGANTCSSGGF